MGAFLVRDNLARRFFIIEKGYPLYEYAEESKIRLFFLCPYAKALWFSLWWSIQWESYSHEDNICNYVEMILKPIEYLPVRNEDKDMFTLSTTLMLEEI